MESSKITTKATTCDEENEQQQFSNNDDTDKTGGCGTETYICINSPTSKHAFYLGVAGVILEGAFTFLGIFGYFVSLAIMKITSKKKKRFSNTLHH